MWEGGLAQGFRYLLRGWAPGVTFFHVDSMPKAEDELLACKLDTHTLSSSLWSVPCCKHGVCCFVRTPMQGALECANRGSEAGPCIGERRRTEPRREGARGHLVLGI